MQNSPENFVTLQTMANIVDYLSFLLSETRRPEQIDAASKAR
jgi:hypothetical protein